ncbi:N-acetylmuramoyl-L-alanine amidase family protein [Campylobacter sp. MG1]|uniref:N-acetylmuramoyl-L-alanine amidase family protein n=1 Tax=Campylobacter sp. MG1 TaxID=2976332 RepID=UPI00226C9E24|nr:N-acetylmuramoyl-L-alanine amidase [Campylobacter sp. MG1]
MNKILFLLISIFLFAGEFDKDFKNFDNIFLNSNKQTQLSLHQKLKTIYIKSLVSDDNNTKKEALKRIVLSSKILNLDASTYEKELSSLGVNPNKISNNNDYKQNNQASKINKTIINKNDNNSNKIKQNNQPDKNVNKTTINKNTTKNNDKVSKENLTKTSEKDNTKNNKIYITNVSKKDNQIIIKLKGKLQKSDIKEFVYNTKEIKNKIIEFDAILDTGRQNIKLGDYDVSIAQFNLVRTRIVLRSKDELEYKYTINDNILTLELNSKIENINSKIEDKKITQNVKSQKQNSKDNSIINNKNKTQDIKVNNPTEKQIKQDFYVNNISKTNSGIKLQFSSNIDEKDLNIFSHGNNKIIELNAILKTKKQNHKFKDYSISVVQFDAKKIRININSKKDKTISYKTDKNSIEIYLEDNDVKNYKNSFKKSNLLITIDAGHGGKDSGASAYGRQEKHIVLSIALKLEKALKQKGYKVFLTRKNDVYIGLRERTKMANDKKSDLFISIHANSVANKSNKVYGIETYFLSPARSERSKNAAAIENKGDIEEMNYFSKQTFLNFLNREKIISSNKLAIDIQGGILSAIPKSYLKKDGGVKEAPFWVLVGALMPAVLIEVGYISHPVEGKNIADDKYQNYLVNGIVNGIDGYFAKNK